MTGAAPKPLTYWELHVAYTTLQDARLKAERDSGASKATVRELSDTEARVQEHMLHAQRELDPGRTVTS